MPLSSVVLVGRPNVGKSTLFNRISDSRRAIVAPIPGTTRDVLAQPAEWQGVRFELVDTGGMFGASQDPLHELVLARGHRAITSADLLILVVDGREGLVPGDRDIAKAVRAADVPTILAINKIDDKRARGVMDFYQLGFDHVVEISAEHASGVGDLLDEVLALLPKAHFGSPGAEGNPAHLETGPTGGRFNRGEPDETAVAIVGRPNAGKSSLVNRLLREERMIVSEMPGTTRDAVDAVLTWHKRRFRIVDTAGIRRAGRVASSGAIESVSVLLARRAIDAADVVVMVVDANAGATDQDAAIAGEADKAGRGVIIAANKWDLMKDREPNFSKAFDETLRRQLKFLDYAPVLHISAATGERTPKVLEWIEKVATSRRTRVKTPELNKFIQRVTAAHPPASPGRRQVRIMYAAQTAIAPPTFVFFTNVATSFHFSYERFLVNELRETFGFMGTPIRIHVRRRTEKAKGDRGAYKGPDGPPRPKGAKRSKSAHGKQSTKSTKNTLSTKGARGKAKPAARRPRRKSE